MNAEIKKIHDYILERHAESLKLFKELGEKFKTETICQYNEVASLPEYRENQQKIQQLTGTLNTLEDIGVFMIEMTGGE